MLAVIEVVWGGGIICVPVCVCGGAVGWVEVRKDTGQTLFVGMKGNLFPVLEGREISGLKRK